MEPSASLEILKSLSIHARFAIALRLFERYVRVRGIEDDSVWAFIEHMWEFPIAEDKDVWERKRGDLADFGLGDEVPEELEEELATLGIDEDYFSIWVSNVVEIAWGSLLRGPQLDESLGHLLTLVDLAEQSGISLPDVKAFEPSLNTVNDGWGPKVDLATLHRWQTSAFEETDGF